MTFLDDPTRVYARGDRAPALDEIIGAAFAR